MKFLDFDTLSLKFSKNMKIESARSCNMEVSHQIQPLQENFRAKESQIQALVEEVNELLEDWKPPVLTPKLDFDFIAKFVRVKKYKTDVAASAIQRYYEHISRNQRRIEGVKPSNYTAAYESKTVILLKTKINGTKMFYVNVRKWDVKKCSFRELISSAMFMVEELAQDPEYQPYGNIVTFDMAGLGFSHVKQLTYSEVKYSILLGLEGLPTRVEGIHVVNAPMVYWPVHKIVMKVLPEKIRNRLHLHTNVESLHRFMDKSILPHTLGGDLDEDDAMDKEIVHKLLSRDVGYDEYWNSEFSGCPRRVTRKRSSMMISHY